MHKLIGMTLAGLLWSGTLLAAQHQYVLTVDGLACPFCAYGVEKKVSALDGVERVDIDIDDGVVVVSLADGSALTEAVAGNAVSEAGFTMRKFEHRAPE